MFLLKKIKLMNTAKSLIKNYENKNDLKFAFEIYNKIIKENPNYLKAKFERYKLIKEFNLYSNYLIKKVKFGIEDIKILIKEKYFYEVSEWELYLDLAIFYDLINNLNLKIIIK